MQNTKLLLLTLSFVFSFNIIALADDNEKFYCNEKIRGYDKGDFVILSSDDVNLRQAPENGRVKKVLSRHTLMRVIDKNNDWYKVTADGTEGYIYAPFTERGYRDTFTVEDFSLGEAELNTVADEAVLQQRLGKIKSKEKKDGRYYYNFDEIKIGTERRKKKIEYIEVHNPEFFTMRGVSVGDASSRAVGQYGVPDSVIYKNKGTVYEYYFEDEKSDEYSFSVDVNRDGIITGLTLEKLD